jgi:hypothetical protein
MSATAATPSDEWIEIRTIWVSNPARGGPGLTPGQGLGFGWHGE